MAAVREARAALRTPHPDLPVIRRALVESGIEETDLHSFWAADASSCDVEALCDYLSAVQSAEAAKAPMRPVVALRAACAALHSRRSADMPVIRHMLAESGITKEELCSAWPADTPDGDVDTLRRRLAVLLSDRAAKAMTPLRQRGELIAMTHNRHRHVASCRKNRLGKDGCRYCVPYVHNIPTRVNQLRQRRLQAGESQEIAPDDVRWCPACVVEGRRSVEASRRAFTDAEAQCVRRRIKQRELLYEALPEIEAPPPPPSEGGPDGSALRQVLKKDPRCLVVEIERPCPPHGAPDRPPTAAEVFAQLKKAVKSNRVLKSGWLESADITVAALRQHMNADEVAVWLNEQCTDAYCDNGVVAPWNEILSAGLECNTAVYTLGAGSNASASTAYFAKYSIKEQHDVKTDQLVVITTAHRQVTTTHVSQAEDAGTVERTAKHLTQRIINTGSERSATEAAMVVLNQFAESHEDKKAYVNPWDLCSEAIKISERETGYVPGGTAAPRDRRSDMRERNGFEGDTGWQGTASTHRYRIGGQDKFASLADHYMYRSRELRCLNALEFTQLYEVRRVVRDGDPSSRVQQGCAFDPQSRAGTRGRQLQVQYPFMEQHPLSETHVCVRRSKYPMPVLAGGTSPRRPKGGALLRKFETWAAYHSAILVPWGYEDVYPVRRHTAVAVVQKHFAPVIRVREFEQWLLSLHTYSRGLAVHAELERPLDRLPAEFQRPPRTGPCPLYMEREYEVAAMLRDVSRRSSGRSCS